jgi:hypothetical protein
MGIIPKHNRRKIMKLTKKELDEIKGNVQISLNRTGVYAHYSQPVLNKDGSVRKNSGLTYEDIEKAKVRYAFLEGLLTKLNKIEPTDD